MSFPEGLENTPLNNFFCFSPRKSGDVYNVARMTQNDDNPGLQLFTCMPILLQHSELFLKN